MRRLDSLDYTPERCTPLIRALWVVAFGLACRETPTTSSARRYETVDFLSATVPTLHVHPGDPVIATLPAGDGEVVQYLAHKNSLGNPIDLIALRKFSLTDPTTADIVTYGSNKLPSQVSLRDGRRVSFDFSQPGQVRITVILPTGESASAWVPLTAAATAQRLSANSSFRTGGSRVTTRAALQNTSSGVSTDGWGVRLNIHVVSGSPAPSPPVVVYGTWWSGLAGETGGAFHAEPVGNGLYTATLPLSTDPISERDIDPVCRSFSSLVEEYCQAATVSGFDPKLAAAACLQAFFPWPWALAACEAAVTLAVISCHYTDICGALTNIIMVALNSAQELTITVRVSGPTCREKQEETFSPPITAALTFHHVFTCPVLVASVIVQPPSASMHEEQTVQLTATTMDGSGTPLSGRIITWTSSLASVATVDNNGLVSGVAPGVATITATSEGQSGRATIAVTPVPVASVTVSPASETLLVGQTVQLTATPKDANGNPLTDRGIAWFTDDASVATVDGSGLVTGVTPGSAIIAAVSEGQRGTATITVHVPVWSVTVTPAIDTLAPGETAQLVATINDADGNVLTGRVVEWTSSNPAAATVSTTGLVAGVTEGTVTITATSEGQSGTAAITVRAPVASVTVTPAIDTVAPGRTLQLTAITKDAVGHLLTGRSVTWATSNSMVASVSTSGLVTGVAEGEATITATSEEKTGTATITVRVPVWSVTVTPAIDTLAPGETVQLVATIKDAAGNVLTGRVVEWTSSFPAVATVSMTGLVTGIAEGQTVITATSEGKGESAEIWVLSASWVVGCGASVSDSILSNTAPVTGGDEVRVDSAVVINGPQCVEQRAGSPPLPPPFAATARLNLTSRWHTGVAEASQASQVDARSFRANGTAAAQVSREGGVFGPVDFIRALSGSSYYVRFFVRSASVYHVTGTLSAAISDSAYGRATASVRLHDELAVDAFNVTVLDANHITARGGTVEVSTSGVLMPGHYTLLIEAHIDVSIGGSYPWPPGNAQAGFSSIVFALSP